MVYWVLHMGSGTTDEFPSTYVNLKEAQVEIDIQPSNITCSPPGLPEKNGKNKQTKNKEHTKKKKLKKHINNKNKNARSIGRLPRLARIQVLVVFVFVFLTKEPKVGKLRGP